MELDFFTGGIFDTHCFYLPKERILVDAPQDCAAWLKKKGYAVELLLLTHGHIDHVVDAARIRREHGCQIAYHPDTLPMLNDPLFFKRLGFGWEIEPAPADFFIQESPSLVLQSLEFQVLEVPGHCPGSLCVLAQKDRMLFGGDVLFAGGIGRWDLPGGDYELLMRGIRGKVLPLGDDVTVLPGHGPTTQIGVERATNPFLVNAPA